MESYLMMLYVTLEQESALKTFFIDQGWSFQKPDLSVITDKLGPCISTSKKTSTPSETVTNIPQNTTVSPGKREPKPRNSRKRISILNQIKQPVAKLPRNKIQPSSTSGSSDLPDKGQQEPLVQIDNAKYEPVFIDDVNHVIVKEEAVDSDYEQDNDVDDNESTDIDESFKQTSADNDASGSRDVTEEDGEQDDETGGETEEGPKQPKMQRGHYRFYTTSAMQAAYKKVLVKNWPIRKAAREFGVPQASLWVRVKGQVDPGSSQFFTREQEEILVCHLLSNIGNGCKRAEILNRLNNYAVSLGFRDKDHPLSLQWYRRFKARWPELNLTKVKKSANSNKS